LQLVTVTLYLLYILTVSGKGQNPGAGPEQITLFFVHCFCL